MQESWWWAQSQQAQLLGLHSLLSPHGPLVDLVAVRKRTMANMDESVNIRDESKVLGEPFVASQD